MAISSEMLRARFADFELDVSSGELIRNGQVIHLQEQPFRILRVLLDRAGEVVTREELQRQLWPDETFVDFEQGLNKAIAKLRDALGDSKTASAVIQTLPRRGYRFTLEVHWIGPLNGQPIPAPILEPPKAPPRRAIPVRYWFPAALAALVLLVGALWTTRRTIAGSLSSRPTIQSIAVLPLTNLSNDHEQEYFADGMTEQLITDLSYVRSLRVLSRESTISFKNSHLSVPQIAEQLDVDAVIQGTVLRSGGIVRTTIRLTAARPERQLWAASYERNLSDAITLQNHIAAEAVAQLRVQLTSDEQTRLTLESRINPEAYDEYLRGRFFLAQEQPDKAIPHLERAIQLDPAFAAAYAELGLAWGMDGALRGNNKEKSAKALEYSQKAVNLDPSSEAYTALGHSLMQAHRWNEGETTLRRAIELDPNNPYAAAYLALLVTLKGRTDEGVRIIREVAKNNPVAVIFLRIYAIILHKAHRFDESIVIVRRALELDPNHLATYGVLGGDLVDTGHFREAEDALRKAGPINPGMQALIYAREGRFTDARGILNDHPSMVSPPSAVARYIMGDKEAGLAELDIVANKNWASRTYYLRVDPLFDPMRNDPRFTEIVKKTGLLDN
jgi:TolB-like protein/DNA-binding winged helix-turn-helix (wHTH) protein/Flp pilus assembly protein TadD